MEGDRVAPSGRVESVDRREDRIGVFSGTATTRIGRDVTPAGVPVRLSIKGISRL